MPEHPFKTHPYGKKEGAAGRASPAAQTQTPERRGGTRFAFSGDAEVVELRSRASLSCRISDLSRGGCYLDTINPFEVGTRVLLRLARGQKTFEAHAVVMYAQRGMGMGLAFTEIKDEHRAILEEWVRELTGEAPLSFESESAPATPRQLQKSDRFVLSELISLLVRKRVLTEKEGAVLLGDLFG